MHGKYVPSLLAAIGQVLEDHMIAIGFIADEGQFPSNQDIARPKVVQIRSGTDESSGTDSRFQQCPKCGQASLIRQEDCDTCISCAYSKCG